MRLGFRQGHHPLFAQLATMVKSGVPLLQSFDIVGKGTNNPAWPSCCSTSRPTSKPAPTWPMRFRKYPQYFDALFCNLVEAGEQAGILDTLLDRLATYKEKIQAIKSKIKGALFYPIAILVVAFVITSVIMIFVIPAFKGVFASFGGELPAPTVIVIAISDYFTANWYSFSAAFTRSFTAFPRPSSARGGTDRQDKYSLKLPVFGDMLTKSSIARWTRTLVHHVRRRRAAGRCARFGRWRRGQLCLRNGDQEDPGRSQTGSSLTVRWRIPDYSRRW
jgi:type IV pilus assembly protein PilC